MWEVKLTGFEVAGKKVINQLGKEDELSTEVSKYDAGKVLGVTPSEKKVSMGGLLTTPLSTQSLMKLKGTLSLQTKETLSTYKGVTTPELYEKTMSRFGGQKLT